MPSPESVPGSRGFIIPIGGAEDKVMLEQVPGVMPLDQTTLVSVQADKCGVEWRRKLVELMRGE
jgi:hypothetical protein